MSSPSKTHYVDLDALRYYILERNSSGWWELFLSDYDGEQREIGSGRTLEIAREMALEHRADLLEREAKR